MTKRRARRVGLGMKPREGSEVSAVAGQPEESIESENADLSAGEGQEEAAEEVVSEAVVGEPEGGGLETSPLQILESGEPEEAAEVENEPIVAPLSDFEEFPVLPNPAGDLLAELLAQSEVVTEAAVVSGGKSMAPAIIWDGDDDPKVIEFPDSPEFVEKCGRQAFFMGELPNGEYRATVRLREGYWEGVKSAAEADHVSVEDWLTNELAQRLEDTFFGRR